MINPSTPTDTIDRIFGLQGRVAVITGGAGLLGRQHAKAIGMAGGTVVLLDIDQAGVAAAIAEQIDIFRSEAMGLTVDITSTEEVRGALATIIERFGRIDILINNAANNPKVETSTNINFSRFENFSLNQWLDDLSVGLTGAFVCSQIFGAEMARCGRGVILNIASDLSLIGPDQRIYRQPNTPEELQPVKPVTYSVVKSGLVGLTRYLATYWAKSGVRVNAISPGGVENGQSEEFMKKLTNLIPLGRMAQIDEYQGAILFLCSDASSYMTGTNLVIDGGRTCW
jgi:NAD(P)-dependent dehydrogenase (short-subunit alcohol dehydrogenase family)